MSEENFKKTIKEKTLGEIVSCMIKIVIKNPEVVEVESSHNGSNKDIYLACLDEINIRERYFKKGASVMLPEHLYLKNKK